MRDINNAGAEELAEIRIWLFQENVRVESARQELEEKIKKFEKEKAVLWKEIREQGRKNEQEKKRLQNEKMFFEKKWKILENGFRELEEDRQKLRAEREQTERDGRRRSSPRIGNYTQGNLIFFKGIHDTVSLRKRYRDLIKIFHPDNVLGDTETIQQINQEYDTLLRYLD